MNTPLSLTKARPVARVPALVRQLRFYLALSRTPHCLLDLATPLLAALLCLGGFPPLGLLCMALLTAFAGYTAVYAVNDIMDYRTDKANQVEFAKVEGYLDGAFMRHPLAQGALTLGQALAWTSCWAVAALAGAWLLNPVCALLLLAGVAMEILYCKLLKVSHLRALVNGVVKTLGALAAILAVDPHPSPLMPTVLFVAVFCWEIGGQNIPADWFDLELDQRQGARTLPLVLGRSKAARLVFACLTGSTLLGASLFLMTPADFAWAWVLAALIPGAVLLLHPALALLARQGKDEAAELFNSASYYPLAMLGVFLLGLAFRG
ncbi:UbiA family prenyltransferase [Fundidesulfovibrio soli]|uniref:UbiA family prenyltransferase n=1 Tax=Fundidesulfovibrio soli TaxID=2922716 RepID=UPI001FAFFDB4|nr:UbiA family prenyltransferase [Fundidesulfovibrio soli]